MATAAVSAVTQAALLAQRAKTVAHTLRGLDAGIGVVNGIRELRGSEDDSDLSTLTDPGFNANDYWDRPQSQPFDNYVPGGGSGSSGTRPIDILQGDGRPMTCYQQCQARSRVQQTVCEQMNQKHKMRMESLGCPGTSCKTKTLVKTCGGSSRGKKKKSCTCKRKSKKRSKSCPGQRKSKSKAAKKKKNCGCS